MKNLKGKRSEWEKDAGYRIKNRKWLRYSSNIARRVLSAIEEKTDLNQKKLAVKIGVTPQYISKVVKGRENLSLETIAKLSEALGVELIVFPTYKYSPLSKLETSAVLFNMTGVVITNQSVKEGYFTIPNEFTIGSGHPTIVSQNVLTGISGLFNNKIPAQLSSNCETIIPINNISSMQTQKIPNGQA